MTIGVGVVLIVLGAIFAYALDVDPPVVDKYVLGWILILGGVLAIVLAFFQTSQRNRRHTTVEERHHDERPPR